MGKLFPKLLVVAQIIKQLKPFVEQHIDKGAFANLRRKFKAAITVVRFFYRRGISKGKKQGRQQERERIASKLRKLGVDPDIIRKATGLTRQELEGLR